MNRKDKASLVQNILNHHFPNPAISLNYTSHYTLLIAVLLSAQCTDVRVNLITPTLFAKADTPEKMTLLPLSEIESVIRPCGLSNNKAKAIKNLSQILIDNYQGNIPKTLQELEKLPGVGHKTASVVVSQALGIPAFPIDTHIHRCAKRWGLSQGRDVKQTEKDLKRLYPKNTWNKLHLQIIYFARTFCPARGHKKENCPICAAIQQET